MGRYLDTMHFLFLINLSLTNFWQPWMANSIIHSVFISWYFILRSLLSPSIYLFILFECMYFYFIQSMIISLIWFIVMFRLSQMWLLAQLCVNIFIPIIHWVISLLMAQKDAPGSSVPMFAYFLSTLPYS